MADQTDFDISQIQMSIDAVQKQHNILHSVTPLLIASDIAAIAAAIEFKVMFLIIVGSFFPILIFFYVFRVRRMSLAPFLTAIGIENKYGGIENNYLSSIYMAYVYDVAYYKQLKNISLIDDPEEKVEKINSILFYKNFGERAGFIAGLPFLGVTQFLLGIFFLLYSSALDMIKNGIVVGYEHIVSVDFFGVPIFEPVTVVTDLILSLLCVFFCARIILVMHRSSQFRNLFMFFFFVGAATFLGGLSNGYPYFMVSGLIKVCSWLLSGFGLLFLELFFIRLIKEMFKNGKKFKALIVFSWAQLIIASILTIVFQDFNVVVYNFAIGLVLIVLTITIYLWTKRNTLFLVNTKGYFAVFIGILINIITSVVYIFNISLSKWVNHEDVCQVLLMISFSFLFHGTFVLAKSKYLKVELM